MSRSRRPTTRRGGAASRQPPTSRHGPDEDLSLAQQVAHGQSTPDRIPPSSLLAVQRTAGNAALLGMAPVQRFGFKKTMKRAGTRVGVSALMALPGAAFGAAIAGAIPVKGRPDTYPSRIYGSQPRRIPVSELKEAATWATRELKKDPTKTSHVCDLPKGSSEWGPSSLLKYMLIELQTYGPELVPGLVRGMQTNSSLEAGAVVQAARAELQRRQAAKQQKKDEEEKQQDPMERIAAAIEAMAAQKRGGGSSGADATGKAPGTAAPATEAKGKTPAWVDDLWGPSSGKPGGDQDGKTPAWAQNLWGPSDAKATPGTGAKKARSPKQDEDVRKGLPLATDDELGTELASRDRKDGGKAGKAATPGVGDLKLSDDEAAELLKKLGTR